MPKFALPMTTFVRERPPCQGGFSLVELAIVLLIVALLIGGMLVPLSAQRDIQNINDTQRQLASINEALLGFAADQRRLPCPAAPNTTGIENPVGGGACTNNHDGFLPAITLGLSPTDAQGYAIDAWGNRIRYSVTNVNTNAFTTSGGMQTAWSVGLTPDLRVCNTAANIVAADCPAADRMTNTAVAVVFSTGKNGGVTPDVSNINEIANWTTSNDRVFVSATPGAAFDDIVVWLSPNILYNRMISAGRLP